MKFEERKQAFVTLGCFLSDYIKDNQVKNSTGYYAQLNAAVQQASAVNYWFTNNNIQQAIAAIATGMLSNTNLNVWLANYPQITTHKAINEGVGIVMAGNIPLVGFHDMLCALLCGYRVAIKASLKDTALIQAIANILSKIEPRFAGSIAFTNAHPVNISAAITTGSNNAARYFELWYANIPHIIRKNRSSIAILTGNESEDELRQLGNDIFSYFGLGCRNVSTLFVPNGYNFDSLFKAIANNATIMQHKGYADCYRYQKAILQLAETPYIDTGFLILTNNISLSAPIALVNYQKYINLEFVNEYINTHQNNIQCVAYQYNDVDNAVKFGQTQCPKLNDYADRIDTMEFLLGIN